MPKNVMSKETREFWKKVLAEIELRTDPLSFKTIFSQVMAEDLTDTSVKILCGTEVLKNTLEKKYKSLIQECVNKITENKVKITIDIKRNQKTNTEKDMGPLFQDVKDQDEYVMDKIKKAGIAPKFTFENFVLGRNNQLAYAIATAVAEKPGEVYNPVFFYSGVGLGKTHLMQAIGNSIISKSPSFKVIYTTGESFTNELIESIQGGKGKGRYTSNEFRNKFRKSDVFLIDDIQFIAGKEATQDEFFHTFNALYMAQKQIVITSDRPPRDFKNIAERITSRFNSGIIADIQPPDYETRVAILRAKRDLRQDQISNGVINIIAENVVTNIRELEGAYLRVLTFATTSGKEIREENVLEILGQTVRDSRKKQVNVGNILKAVCSYYSVKSTDIKGKRRTKEFVIPRQVAMYLIKEMTDAPFMTIGELLGGRDHTTIMYGVEKVEEEIKETGKIRQDVLNVKQMILAE